MSDIQITCINKPHRQSPHEHITHLGGPGGWWTRDQVVAAIDSGSNTFYTMVNGRRADIGVNSNGHSRFPQTHADRYWNNNLLALPECRRN
jgi:Protein of unknown function (DUF3892)